MFGKSCDRRQECGHGRRDKTAPWLLFDKPPAGPGGNPPKSQANPSDRRKREEIGKKKKSLKKTRLPKLMTARCDSCRTDKIQKNSWESRGRGMALRQFGACRKGEWIFFKSYKEEIIRGRSESGRTAGEAGFEEGSWESVCGFKTTSW